MSTHTVTMLENGLMPLPDKMLEELNIKDGDILEFSYVNNQILFKKVEREVSEEELESNEFLSLVILLDDTLRPL
jgi:bifunctional DNA-binding transcriptional regulator/antitoxin component of YhaV-PrlF toxin-antitoxin module